MARVQSRRMETAAADGALPRAGRLVETVTRRERQILEMLCEGHSNQAIAECLCISIDAVKYHLKNIFGKLHVNCRLQAVAQAVYLGMVLPSWADQVRGKRLLAVGAGATE